jgi:hypothetical protein
LGCSPHWPVAAAEQPSRDTPHPGVPVVDGCPGRFDHARLQRLPHRLDRLPDNSWSTGGNAAINSIYLRLLALNPRLMNKTSTTP